MPEKEWVLLFDPAKCTACHYCEIACSYQHFGQLDLKKSNLHILFEPRNNIVACVHCMHCSNALCLEACPTKAIFRDDDTNLVKINQLRCVGCGSCVAACPLAAPWLNAEEGAARKCDFCDGDPKCAKFCSPGAIKVIKRSDYKRLARDGRD